VRNAFSVISSGTERSRVELSQKSLFGKARERPDLVRQVLDKARREGLRATAGAVRSKLADETPVGYSSAGVAIEVGPAARGLKPGDLIACGGGGHANHAEIVAVPVNLCAKVPDGAPLEQASLATIAAIALHGIRLAEVTIGDRVAVIGCGLVGRLACKLLRCAGCEVLAIDIDGARLEGLEGRDADRVALVGEAAGVVQHATEGVGVDAALVTAGADSPDPLLLGADLCRDRGSLVLVGAVPIELPRAPLYGKELRLRVSRSYGPGRYDEEYEERGLDYPIGYVRWTEGRNMEAVLRLLAAGRLDLADLIDEVLPVQSAADAYARLTGEASTPPRGALLLSYDGRGGEEAVAPREGRIEARPHPAATKRSVTAPLRLGLIGPGGFATRVIAPAFDAAGARLELVGGGAGPSADAATRHLGFARVAADPSAVIEDPSVDAVAICTRHGTHAALVVEALGAGKHVFCEKPLALTREELEAVIAAESASAGALAVGFNRRFSPHLEETRDFLAESRPLTVSYRVSAGRLPPDHWTHDLEQGGGRLLGEACHFIDCARFLFDSPIATVHADGRGDPHLPRKAHDNLVIGLTAVDGSVGSIVYSSDGASKLGKERLEAFGGSRTAILDDYRALELIDGNDRRSSRLRAQDKGHEEEVRRFVEAATAGESPVPVAEVLNVSLAAIAAVESLEHGAAVGIRS
jgi:predicted dehydrogenase/threonine dehydrogenase-like Zn-dependent dehydrogenase